MLATGDGTILPAYECSGGMSARLAETLMAERDRWALWLPVGVGAGVALYFALPLEPPSWLGLALLVVSAGLAWSARRRQALLAVLAAAVAVAAGLAAAQVRSAVVAAPILRQQIGPLPVTGKIVEVERQKGSQRVVLEEIAFDSGAARPHRARIRLIASSPPVRPGQRLEVLAVLRPPPPPAAPGAYDFARRAWFEGLGAVGYALGHPRILAGDGGDGATTRLRLAIERLRQIITDRILAAIPGPPGAVAAALVTGERGEIPDDLWQAYRDAGLAHLLAISGMHMGMVAALVFLIVRGALALVPPLALRHPIKKWTAAVALAATFCYLLIAGAPVPTQRAFLMIGLVLLAVMVDRTAISMRTVAWAALAILVSSPETLVGASFQLSFAAVVALVAVYETLGERFAGWRAGSGRLRRLLLYLAGVGFTTIIAGAATGVIGLHHFSRVAAYGLAANLVAVPLTGFWVMPAALLSLVMMPFGLEAWPLTWMGMGIAAIDEVALTVASWRGASIGTAPLPLAGLVPFVLGGLWLCLWRRRWRLLGLAPMALGLLALPLSRPPDLLVNGDGSLAAVRAADGSLLFSSQRADRFTAQLWIERAGAGRPPGRWPKGAGADGRLACDSLGCLYRARGQVLSFVKGRGALAEDCRAATVMVSTIPVRGECDGPSVIVDRFDLWRHGAHAIWLSPERIEVVSTAAWQGDRPWTYRPPDKRRRTRKTVRTYAPTR